MALDFRILLLIADRPRRKEVIKSNNQSSEKVSKVFLNRDVFV